MIAVISIRRMAPGELERIGEVDRSEHITREYVVSDGALERREVDVRARPWSVTGSHAHSVRARLAEWRPILGGGGVLIGAFEGPALAGFAVLRPEIAPGMDDLAALYVGAPHRRRGVGARLTREVVETARARGARRLYVSATPTASTVDFYRARGFELAPVPHPDLLRAEPDDIHMILELERPGSGRVGASE